MKMRYEGELFYDQIKRANTNITYIIDLTAAIQRFDKEQKASTEVSESQTKNNSPLREISSEQQ
jgi:hypothetical protein